MPTTTNFGWTTPADTDYVKDGALAIRTLGNGIDTSLVDLKGGTSGQILAKNSNTDMDFVWIANDQGDITGVTASSPLTGGGTSGAITVGIQDGTTAQKGAVQLEDSTSSTSTTKAATPNSVKSAYDLAGAAIAKSLIDAEGDLIVGDAADAVQRLAIGTTGQVLTVDTAVDGKIKWAAAAAGDDMPAFRATNSGTQSISALTWTKIDFQTETFDTNNNFASSRFTPTVEGYYQINASIKASTATRSGYFFTMYKNGSADTLFDAQDDEDGSTEYYESGSGLVYLNGSTDYVEMYMLTGAASTVASGSSSEVRFTGAGVRKA